MNFKAEGIFMLYFIEIKSPLYYPQKDLVVNRSLKICELCNFLC